MTLDEGVDMNIDSYTQSQQMNPPNKDLFSGAEYQILWRGKRLGGILTISRAIDFPSSIFYFLDLSPADCNFIGEVHLPHSSHLTADIVVELILQNIEWAYIASVEVELKEGKENGNITIQ